MNGAVSWAPALCPWSPLLFWVDGVASWNHRVFNGGQWKASVVGAPRVQDAVGALEKDCKEFLAANFQEGTRCVCIEIPLWRRGSGLCAESITLLSEELERIFDGPQIAFGAVGSSPRGCSFSGFFLLPFVIYHFLYPGVTGGIFCRSC